MKKVVFTMALLIFLAAISYASTAASEPNYKHQSGSKATHRIVHPVDHFTI
ncbi:hypothetical protein [Cytophaga hutchinsonii]|uniref:Uncharacterized protein n=1 Tax=Cytophaga hutchinsonii (strain ATCC 33406 / DSM 1761 / CIP 103989 / NBRC 15051 / NCIMB 9469 / D465) TaxID=269798 RepID=A0A6N4SSY3_CYTH3|nr:hypothetical protein [Cytophaga hutchinsonii]ABG59527.1 hypothetical protein CHU_2264 [Cytophaga hutchinsonii ATCC 33406]SFX94869.1 hypothetical protein SAMN04487930_11442 [Cytophaga hutchinsonii ATCC 33406]